MEVTIHEQNGVIVRRFSGEVCIEDMMESWNKLLASYTNLKDYKGILTSFLDAEIIHEDQNLNVLIEFLKNHLDQLKDLKIAVVMNTPMVTNTIILGQRVKSLQIKPFSTIEAAMQWIDN
jgi:chaperone required for assembly of F1-ATPase